MADRLLRVFGYQALQFGLGAFVLEISRLGSGEERRELRPGVGRAHIDDPNRFDARLRRLDAEEAQGARRSRRSARTFVSAVNRRCW